MMRKDRNHSTHARTLVLILFACVAAHLSYSQKITNVDFEVTGNTVRVNYDITGCSENEIYDIKLSLGIDGELTKITRGLSGDVKDVQCGSSRVILWDVLSDRDELRGSVYFAVEIERIRRTIEPVEEVFEESESTEESKWSSRRSWRADKGYVGGSIGLFTPYQNYLHAPYSPRQNGFFINTSIAYIPSTLLGITTTIYFYSAPTMDKLRITSQTYVLLKGIPHSAYNTFFSQNSIESQYLNYMLRPTLPDRGYQCPTYLRLERSSNSRSAV